MSLKAGGSSVVQVLGQDVRGLFKFSFVKDNVCKVFDDNLLEGVHKFDTTLNDVFSITNSSCVAQC